MGCVILIMYALVEDSNNFFAPTGFQCRDCRPGFLTLGVCHGHD